MEELNQLLFETRVEEDGQPCVILCSRKSCHVCQAVHPVLETLEQEYRPRGLAFYHLDVEEQADLFQQLRGKGVPQVLCYGDGELKSRLVGEHSEDEYADQMDALL